MRTPLAATLIAIAALGFAAPARADSDDTVFLRAMHSHGFTFYGGDQEAIHIGHLVCNVLGDGYSMTAVEKMGALHAKNGLTDGDVKFLVETSAAAYCPQYIT